MSSNINSLFFVKQVLESDTTCLLCRMEAIPDFHFRMDFISVR
jgi:hypothetical protein